MILPKGDHWFGWRSVFIFMACFAGGVGWWCWAALPETLSPDRRQPFHPAYLARAYWSVWTNFSFISISVAAAMGFAGLFIYVLSAPVFLMQHLGVSETGFLWLFGPSTLGLAGGALLSGRFAGKLMPSQTAVVGCVIMACAAVFNLLLNFLTPPSLPWSVLPLFFYNLGLALSLPSVTLLALDLFPRQRGLAASCQSFLQSANSTLVSLLAPLVWGTTRSLALTQFGFVAVCAGGLGLYRWRLTRVKNIASNTSPVVVGD